MRYLRCPEGDSILHLQSTYHVPADRYAELEYVMCAPCALVWGSRAGPESFITKDIKWQMRGSGKNIIMVIEYDAVIHCVS